MPLPVLGGTVAVVRRAADDHEVSTADLVLAVERDEAFATNLLGFANSAANARPMRVGSIRQAVTLLGRRQLAELALEAATYRFLEEMPGDTASRGQLHLHSLAVAAAACAAADLAGVARDDVHLAALLHDVGKLVMPRAFGVARLREIADEAPAGVDRARLERERLGVDHAYAGALLVRGSGADDATVEAIEAHHGGRSGQECESPVAACVQLGDAVVRLVAGQDPGQELTAVALRRLGLEAEALDEIAETAASSEPAGSTRGSLAARVGELERLASTDDLTGLANRRAWLQATSAQLQASGRGALCICDIDHFKTINDSYGHRFGDLVLTEVARVLERHGGPGRLGGDEFALFVADEDAASGIAERIIESCRAVAAYGSAVSVSVGIAEVSRHGTDTGALLEAADAALYEAKRAGRACVRLAA